MKIVLAVVLTLAIAGGIYVFALAPQNEVDDEKPLTTYSPGDAFITNIKDSARLLKASLVLAVDDAKKEEYMTENNYIIRDTIIYELRQKNEQELRSPDIQDKLRTEIVESLKQKLQMKYLVTVYFDEFVLQ